MGRTTKHRPMTIALIGSLSLAAAFLVACGDDSDSSTTASQATLATTIAPHYVVPGGAPLTERQREMVTVTEKFIAAWQANDGEGVASLMTAGGEVVMPGENLTLLVSDGTLQQRVESIAAYSTLHALDPMLVHQDWIAVAGRIDSISVDWLIVLEFTSTGEVKIVSMTDFH